MSYIKNEKGEWIATKPVKGAHSSYQEMMIKCLNAIDSIYCQAKNKCEFEFIQTLLRIRGLQDAGWDPFQTLADVFTTFNVIKRKLRDHNQTAHLALFTYGMIFEASEPYEILANLLRIIEGLRFNINNFPDTIDRKGRRRSLHPLDKVTQLKNSAKRNGLDLSFFDDFTDNKLRNAIFHCDYSVYWPNVRIFSPLKEYKHEEWLSLINKAMAYYEALSKIHHLHISLYQRPKIIDVHPDFARHPDEKAITIIRKKYGLIGIRSNWSQEQLTNGFIPWRLCHSMPYERKMIGQGCLVLPPNRIKVANRIVKWIPEYFRSSAIRMISKYYIGRELPK